MPNVNVDLIGPNGNGAQGPVAGKLAGNSMFDPNNMRPFISETDGQPYVSIYKGAGDRSDPNNYKTKLITQATLRRDEWKGLDDAVLEISETRLGGVADLISNGLIYNLANPMGTTQLEWHDMSDALTAVVTMDGVTRGINDAVDFKTNYLPIPIIHADYEINARTLASSRSLGNALDTTMAERAARKVKQTLEDMLFTNTTYAWGDVDDRNRNSIYSYINHPDRNQVTLSTNWDDSSKTAAGIVSEVLSLIQTSINAMHYGPWMLYIPTAYQTVLEEDYDDTRGNTIRQRIMAFEGLNGIKVVDSLPANNVLLVQMTRDVVRLVRGMDLQNIEWAVEANFLFKYKVLTIQVPQIRSDQKGNSGVTQLASSFA